MLPPDVTSSSNVLSPWYTVTSRVRLPCCASPTGTLFEPFTRISCDVAVGSKDEATTCVLERIVDAVYCRRPCSTEMALPPTDSAARPVSTPPMRSITKR